MTLSVVPVDIVLSATPSVVFAAAQGAQYVVLKAAVTNTDTVSRTVTVYRLPPSGTPGPGYILAADALAIPAGTSVTLQLAGQAIVSGQSLQAAASVASVVNFNVTFAQVP